MTERLSSNLVVELRLLAANPSRREAPAGARHLCTAAADEIERLSRAVQLGEAHPRVLAENAGLRAEIERLQRDLNAARDPLALGNLSRRCDELYASEQRLRAALDAAMCGSIRYVGYDCADCGMQIIEGRSVCRKTGNPHTPPKNGLGSQRAADETISAPCEHRWDRKPPYDRDAWTCPKCGAEAVGMPPRVTVNGEPAP